MNVKMTRQQSAEIILDILVNDLNLKSGHPLSNPQLKDKFRARNGDSTDLSK